MRTAGIIILFFASIICKGQFRSLEIHSWRASQRLIYCDINVKGDTSFTYSFHASEYPALNITGHIYMNSKSDFRGFVRQCDSLLNDVSLASNESIHLRLRLGNSAMLTHLLFGKVLYVWDGDESYSSIIDNYELKHLKKALIIMNKNY